MSRPAIAVPPEPRNEPVNDYAHYALGRCLEKQGRDVEANSHYKLASSLRPGSDQYRARIRDLD